MVLQRKLQQSDAVAVALKQRLTGSLASVAAASSEASGSNSSAALKLVIDVLHRDIEFLRARATAAEMSAASANMEAIVHASNARAACAVAAALPASQRRLLHACSSLQCELDLQVRLLNDQPPIPPAHFILLPLAHAPAPSIFPRLSFSTGYLAPCAADGSALGTTRGWSSLLL